MAKQNFSPKGIQFRQDDDRRNDLADLKKSLDSLGGIVDKAGSAISQAAAGNISGVGSAASAGVGVAASAIPELAPIAAALAALAPLLDKLASVVLPEATASIRSLGDIQRAGSRLKPEVEEAAAYGVDYSSEMIAERLRAETLAENRRTQADVRLENAVTEAQVGRLFR